MIIDETIDLLGMKVKDKMTGMQGYVTSVCFDLYGCIQLIIAPDGLTKEGTAKDSFGWIDINRISIISKKKIMEVPDHENKYKSRKDVNGPASKPMK